MTRNGREDTLSGCYLSFHRQQTALLRKEQHVFPRISYRVTEHCDGSDGTVRHPMIICITDLQCRISVPPTVLLATCITARNVLGCLPETCPSSGSIRLSGVSAHNVCMGLHPLFKPQPINSANPPLQPDLPCTLSD